MIAFFSPDEERVQSPDTECPLVHDPMGGNEEKADHVMIIHVDDSWVDNPGVHNKDYLVCSTVVHQDEVRDHIIEIGFENIVHHAGPLTSTQADTIERRILERHAKLTVADVSDLMVSFPAEADDARKLHVVAIAELIVGEVDAALEELQLRKGKKAA